VWGSRRESMARRKASAVGSTAAALILCLAASAPVQGQDMLIQTSMGGTGGTGGAGASALTSQRALYLQVGRVLQLENAVVG